MQSEQHLGCDAPRALHCRVLMELTLVVEEEDDDEALRMHVCGQVSQIECGAHANAPHAPAFTHVALQECAALGWRGDACRPWRPRAVLRHHDAGASPAFLVLGLALLLGPGRLWGSGGGGSSSGLGRRRLA